MRKIREELAEDRKARGEGPVQWGLSNVRLAEKMSRELGPLCGCGCGGHVVWGSQKRRWNEFLPQHHGLGKKHSEATREKMRRAHSGKKLSEETKKKLRGREFSKETREKLRNTRLGKRHTEKAKEKNRIAHLGKRASEATRKKLREALLRGYAEGRRKPLEHSMARGGFREDLGFFVRSSWEANFARLLGFLGVEYEYESRRFVIEDVHGDVVTTYLPDFFLVDLDRYVEIKGWWLPEARRKVRLFRGTYPDVELDIVDKVAYRHLVSKFSKLVPNWE